MKKINIIFRQLRTYQGQEKKENNLQVRYRLYRNQIVSLIKISKKLHMQNYFMVNSRNMRKPWPGIKNIYSLFQAKFSSCFENCHKTILHVNIFACLYE